MEKKEMLSQIAEADSNGKLRSKKLYLYFTQMGRCMYTGEPIDLGELFNDNLYDIDHIYPRHFVKDDNINSNLVLVRKQKNAHKSDNYPIEPEIRNNPKVFGLWKNLHKNGLITEEKYRRLTGSKPFTEEQLAGFIARQMVETGQGTKGVADLLRQLLPEETDIVYAKAGNVSDFRRRYDLLKSRSVNDFHHAHDAYLNIVVGNAYYVKFTRDPRNFIMKEFRKDREKYRYHLEKMFDWDIVRGEETAWSAAKSGDSGTITTVKRVMGRNTPTLTRMSFVNHGGIANETLYGAAKAKPGVYIPLKASDPKMADVEKYGGFTSASTAYFFLVEHGEAKKRVRTLETVPIYLKDRFENDPNGLADYCRDELKLTDPSIRMPKIRMQSLVKRNGYYLHLSGKTGNQIVLRNAVSLCLRQEWISYIHDIDKYIERGVAKESLSEEKNCELYNILLGKHADSIYANRPNAVGNTLKKGVERFNSLSLDDQLRVLNQIIQLSRIGTASADLSLIGGAAKSGVLIMSKTISKCGEFRLINQSPTGIHGNEIDLLTV